VGSSLRIGYGESGSAGKPVPMIVEGVATWAIRSTSSASWTRKPRSTGRSSRNCRADENRHT